MKEHKSNKFYSSLLSLLGLLIIFSSVSAQEYDDMYFNKTDRKKIKTENNRVNAQQIKGTEDIDYSQATQSTELYSTKNVNPEYIARYKATETNEIPEVKTKNEYSSGDYFIEDYDTENSEIGSHMNQIDYAALNKRDQMSYSNFNRNYSNPYWSRPSWGFYPSMSMGYGFGSPFMYDPFMYDPFMMGGFGYGPMMSMGIGYGFGTGFYPSMSYSLAMSWGTGYNPWGGWGAYPYSPYGMRGFYDPWGWSPYRYSPYYGYGFGSFYGYSSAYYASNPNYFENGRNIQYKSRRTSRSATSNRIVTSGNENTRVSSAESKIRVPSRTVSNSSNGRISRDYSKTQNEIYRSSRSNSASQRISTSRANRSSFSRSSGSTNYNTSAISTNRPSRLNNSSSSFNRSESRSSYSGYNRSGNSSSYSPSRSGSSSPNFNRSNSYGGSRSSSFSSGSRSSSSSSGSRSSGGSSRSGGRQ